ncbi:MAG: hypothetical protein EAZ89_08955 [Bacteroidetes bacterium]|jgi:hypothetical protein|nr:MAG: hypothetical protein EAZ89_08955 [Bacteroidota bacterium]
MNSLGSNWFMEGTLDFEYKKYVLLAYLQHVSREFAEVKLYPCFSELISHYQNLLSFQEHKEKLSRQFPGRLDEEAFRRLQLQHLPAFDESPEMQEIESIIGFALPVIRGRLDEGKEIYEQIEGQLRIEPVGIMPLYKQEGYVFFQIKNERTIKIYQYKIIFFENTEGNYHGISFRYVDSFLYSLANTPESVKLQLARSSELPNPATWMLCSMRSFDEDATLLPIAKRKLLSYLK